MLVDGDAQASPPPAAASRESAASSAYVMKVRGGKPHKVVGQGAATLASPHPHTGRSWHGIQFATR